MPIKGISDRVRLPRLGKIRLGIVVEGHHGSYPQPVDYFVCPDPVKKVHGERPRELPILFPDEDDSRWAAQFYRCYSRTKGLICKGDGDRAGAIIDQLTASPSSHRTRQTSQRDIDCHPATCPFHGRQCRRVMNLQFLLPDVPGLGVWQIDTSSLWSITGINNSLQLLRQTCSRVSMIPLTLRIQPRNVQLNGLNKTIHVLTLDAPFTLSEMLRYVRLKEKETHARQ